MVDGIPYLRTGRRGLADRALSCLDAGDRAGALLCLLADQDDWWDGPPPDPRDLRRLVDEQASLSLREAMGLLAYGRVGDYFAHRWTDPTYLAGLALIEAHWADPASAFELACGIGHYLRDLGQRGLRTAGADVVFSKLWLARHWVAGLAADLVCFDAGTSWPPASLRADLILCQDAFYFLEPKAGILARLRGIAGRDGLVVIGHIHNREAPGFSAGRAVTAAEIGAMFPAAIVYDDQELTRAAVEMRAPCPATPLDLRSAEAFSLAEAPIRPAAARAVTGRLVLPPQDASLRRNPLYQGGEGIAWPSELYRREYGPRATYPARTTVPETATLRPEVADAVRRRELVALPERW